MSKKELIRFTYAIYTVVLGNFLVLSTGHNCNSLKAEVAPNMDGTLKH